MGWRCSTYTWADSAEWIIVSLHANRETLHIQTIIIVVHAFFFNKSIQHLRRSHINHFLHTSLYRYNLCDMLNTLQKKKTQNVVCRNWKCFRLCIVCKIQQIFLWKVTMYCIHITNIIYFVGTYSTWLLCYYVQMQCRTPENLVKITHIYTTFDGHCSLW